MSQDKMKTRGFDSKCSPKLGNERAQQIITKRRQFPGASNAELGRRLNISREWVRQVLTQANLPTRAQNKNCELVCDGCGITFRRGKKLIKYQRAKGQERFYHNKKCYLRSRLNPLKYKAKRKWDYNAIYQLRNKKNWGSVRIGRELGIPTATIACILKKKNLTREYKKRDCNEVCKLRKEKGWGYAKISERLGITKDAVAYILKKSKLTKRRKKWDHEVVWKLRREKNWGTVRIARELGIPDSTVSFILKKENAQ
ncbi:MAG: hypothetical protein HY730_00570 [Candidatus Tectomicrobia bacterium]|uniref:RNA polymerase sigma-70 region 4 domain-containing protein n=1 Tax=Tectimicrobiota bacterium TaxID=2528274 RepID=A0A933LPP1_UNCTE|nr:hypothetical protein [Candidatus Tectomicrobia bacterium]